MLRILRAVLLLLGVRLLAVSQYDTDDMQELYAATTVAELRQNSKWLMLTSQQDTMEWANGGAKSQKVNIPNWAYTADADAGAAGNQPAGINVVDRARGGAWTAAISGRSDTLEFTRSDGSQASNEIDVEDEAELPWPVAEQTRSRQMYQMRQSVDAKIFAAWIGGIGTGSAEQTTLGAAADTISRSNPLTTAGLGYELVYHALRAYSVKLERRGAFSLESDSIGRAFVVMPPEFWDGFEAWMLNKGYGWDELTEEMLVQGRTMGMGDFRKRMKGLDIFVENKIAVPSSGNWNFYGGVRESWRANVRRLPGYVQMFEPAENQISNHPATLMRQAVDVGHLEITKGDLANINHRFIVRGSA